MFGYGAAGLIPDNANSGSAPASHGGSADTLLTAPPDDPQFVNQWHFNQLGDIQSIWAEFDGTGVNVGIYDEGVQYTHTDLNDNYDTSLHITVNSVLYDGAQVGNAPHGTSVAGLIAAEGNNTEGGIGVAHGATLAGVNIFDSASALYINAVDFSGFIGALEQASTFDVVNNSWGSTPGFAASQNVNVTDSFAAQVVAAWEGVVEDGRDGLGTIVVKSSGNESRNSNGESSNSSRYTITVAALRDNGFASSYSNHGADVLITASAGDLASQGGLGIVTTDLLGTDGYNLRSNTAASSDFTDNFGGTSAAAPIVSGVVALMLDANAGLGWRDVQEVLSIGARHTGTAIGATSAGPYENGNWFFNGGNDWNGGGRHFSVNYGYGMVDAYNSVRIAEAWQLFAPDAATSANEATITASNLIGGPINDMNESMFTVSGAGHFDIEHITVTVTLTHTYFTDLNIYLVSPDGKEVMLADRSAGSSSTSDAPFTWSFGVDSFRGADAFGDWKIRIDDMIRQDSGTLASVQMDFFGTAAHTDSVYHFTNEFSDMVALDASRSAIADTDGGKDWLDMAAVNTAIVMDLTKGKGTIDGVSVTASGIDNLVGGDGDDKLTGSRTANELAGGRGEDLLRGGKGSDEFRYMSLRDSLVGDNHDIILDFAKKDKVDLGLIDAVTGTGIDDDFSYIGSKAFHSIAGELHIVLFDVKGKKNDMTIVEGDVDGNGTADFMIELAGIHKMKGGDFML
ncbi:MAG: regulatory domain of in-like proprotein convertase [Rhizobium sp.]|nr:regulatory domain of in-like proprotein convertase [Rhizobium sp.]